VDGRVEALSQEQTELMAFKLQQQVADQLKYHRGITRKGPHTFLQTECFSSHISLPPSTPSHKLWATASNFGKNRYKRSKG
jgi:hypothetical protein